MLLPPKWTSEAIITPPESTQLSHLQQELIPLQVLGIDTGIDQNELFSSFLKKFLSQLEQEEYISTSSEFILKFKKHNADNIKIHQFMTVTSEKIKARNNKLDKNNSQPYSSWTLSYTGTTPEEAQSFLNSYIEFVADKVVAQYFEGIRDTVALKVQIEKDSLKLERSKLANIQDTLIKRLNYSLQIAKAAGIISPVYSNGPAELNDDPDFSISLGAEGIKRKLEIEQSIHDVSELNAELRNAEYQLTMLEKVRIQEMAFLVFKYQKPPSLPVKDDIHHILLISIVVSLGMIASAIYVLLSNSIAIYRSHNNSSKTN